MSNINLKDLIEHSLSNTDAGDYLTVVESDADWASLTHDMTGEDQLLASMNDGQLFVHSILAKVDEVKNPECATDLLRVNAIMPLAETCIMTFEGEEYYVLSGNTGLTGSIDADANLFIEQVNAVASGFDDAMHVIEKHL